MNNDRVNIATHLESGRRMCINYLPEPEVDTEVILDVYAVNNGSYTLNFEELESFEGLYDIILVDNFKSIETNLAEIETYAFDVNKDEPLSYGPNRFKIVFQNKVTGLELPDLTSGLQVYPNPANDFVTIEINDSDIRNTEDIQVQVYEISTNRLMLQQELRNNGNNYKINLNISNFGRGVYLVLVSTDDKKYNTKFVKH